MIQKLKMIIHKIKGINHGEIELPIQNGLYAIVGSNGSGKSTIMLCIAQLIGKHNLSNVLRDNDFFSDSYIEYQLDDKKVERWTCANHFWKANTYPDLLSFNGTYEGSLFYGARFKDSRNVDEKLQEGKISSVDIVDADSYIQEKLGEILHNDPLYYSGLKKIRNKKIAEALGLKNTPYFINFNGNNISQYRMSSGECLLISLLHFIYNSIVRRSLPSDKPIIMLIDEIELALHPVAVSNFISYIEDLLSEYPNLMVLVTSHSTEVIRAINPRNMFKLERIKNLDNEFNIVNPCYPSYAIRDIYQPFGFDVILLVEDILAKIIVDKFLLDNNLTVSRLINVIPSGGWNNVLSLHNELLLHNVLGDKTKIISILDGDIRENRENKGALKKFNSLKILYLPIPSVEKYLHKILIKEPNNEISIKMEKEINDRFFRVKSLKQIVSEYKNHQKEKIIKLRELNKKKSGIERIESVEIYDIIKSDNNGKTLYNDFIEKELKNRNIQEERFIIVLHELLLKYESENLMKFSNSLTKMIDL
ncbi:hypothetical protein IO44_02100 [Gallibacterium anatis str. Avicor]|uniref:ATP-dependent nuclease n=1 Tax=Gallibacterium anatis TaxID=750 RepID=UPI0005315D16|nr:AAA family ATPase [Gallibacterium anatis]KGQ56725.1 hypothetical protein IO44_02100 [Gallibacterium anatis str. Avicor]